MFLFFSCVTPEGGLERHTLQSEELEIQLEVINSYAAFGYLLLSAYLIDEKGGRTHLPLEAFDGRQISRHMHKLEKEYQLVLNL